MTAHVQHMSCERVFDLIIPSHDGRQDDHDSPLEIMPAQISGVSKQTADAFFGPSTLSHPGTFPILLISLFIEILHTLAPHTH